jgi:hypothetical protein
MSACLLPATKLSKVSSVTSVTIRIGDVLCWGEI